MAVSFAGTARLAGVKDGESTFRTFLNLLAEISHEACPGARPIMPSPAVCPPDMRTTENIFNVRVALRLKRLIWIVVERASRLFITAMPVYQNIPTESIFCIV